MKSIRLHRAIEKILQEWPATVKAELADLFGLLAAGQSIGMPTSRPMPDVAPGVFELRIKDRSGQFRIFYFTKHANAILVFHDFRKKTQATPKNELKIAKQRLGDLL